MKAKSIVMSIAVVCVAFGVCLGQGSNMGTWKLNEAKSKFPAGAPKNNTVVYESAGGNVKVTVDGVDAQGKATHNEWTGKFDGKDYPLKGDPQSNTRSYKTINDHTTELTNKKDGKVTATGRIEISSDGKSRTVTVKGTDGQGTPVTYSAVYDKQ